MANSLRAKLSKLRYVRHITEEEYQELIKKLDGHDAKVRADAIDEYKKKIEFEYKWLLDCKVFEPNVGIAFNTLISYADQLKGQKE